MPQALSLRAAAQAATARFSAAEVAALLRRPTIIVSAPRSGSNLLFEHLSRIGGFWTIGGESHAVFAAFPHLRAENEDLDSGSLRASHADPATCDEMRRLFLFLMQDHRRLPFVHTPSGSRPREAALLEKTPRNALNIPFLLEVFPEARFIFLYRDARENVASIAEAWRVGLQTGRFVTFSDLRGWDRPAWCFLLPPGWRAMIGRSLIEIAAFQWSASNEIILDQLRHLPVSRRAAVSYRELVEAPGDTLQRLARFAGLPGSGTDRICGPLPLSRTTLTAPDTDKWKCHEADIAALVPALEATEQRIRRFLQ